MSDPIRDGGPAFPKPDTIHPNGQVEYGSTGMNLRAYLAANALNGLCSSLRPSDWEDSEPEEPTDWIPRVAVMMADNLMEELKQYRVQ